MEIKILNKVKKAFQEGREKISNSPERAILLFITLIATTLVLEALSFEHEVLSYTLMGSSFILAVPNIFFLMKRSQEEPIKYMWLIITSSVSLSLVYFISIKLANTIPFFSNLLSYITILLDLTIIYLLADTVRKYFKSTENFSNRNNLLTIGILMIVTLFCAYNTLTNLSEQIFHQDERFSLQVAKGYYETEEYVLWDFFNDESTGTLYTRNTILTKILSVTGQYLEFGEVSMRIPTAAIAILGTITMFLGTKQITASNKFALIASTLWAFNDLIIYFGRFSRGYIFLMFFVQQILFLSWVLFNSKKFKYDILAFALISIYFIVGYGFHQSILSIAPIVVLCVIIKYWKVIWKYKKQTFLILISGLILTLLGAWYFKLYQHFGFCITCEPQTIYLSHILEPYNWINPLLFVFLSFLLLSITKFKLDFRNISIISLFLSLFVSIFLFNRYEDFRYVAVLQPLVIIVFTYIITFYTQGIKAKPIFKSIITLVIVLLFVKIQIPNVTKDTLFTVSAQANWGNIEGNRIHRRAARPDSEKAFDYIFENEENIILVRLLDGGINWVDDYYLNFYIDKYQPESIKLYYEYLNPYQYNKYSLYLKYGNEQRSGPNLDLITWKDILDENDGENIYVLANIATSTEAEQLIEIQKSCENIAKIIGIPSFVYFDTPISQSNHYFPNIYLCD